MPLSPFTRRRFYEPTISGSDCCRSLGCFIASDLLPMSPSLVKMVQLASGAWEIHRGHMYAFVG